jgi:ribonuclease-3
MRTPSESPRSARPGNTSRRRAAPKTAETPRATLEELQDRIGIAFRDSTLLQEALTHSSFANETPQVSPRDNERLEYLGDAVLQLITAEYLYKYRPAAQEGELTQTRSSMVNTNTLAALSEDLGVGDYLFLGKGIAKGGGRSLKSLLANAFEAILGAVFLDAGYDAAYHFYLDRFRRLPEPVKDENHKGRLQQVVQERFNQTPYYDSGGGRGSGHHREYTAVVFAGAEALGTGHGPTKQEAEQAAANDALGKLLGRPAAPGTARDRDGRRRRSPRRSETAEKPGEDSAAAAAAAAGAPAEAHGSGAPAEAHGSGAPAEAHGSDVTPSEVADVLAVEEAVVEGIQPLAEPVATPAVGGPEPERPRRRRSSTRRQAAAKAEPAPEAAAVPVETPVEPAAAAEPAPAAPARRRRSPRRKAAAAPETHAEQTSSPEPSPPPAEPAPAEPPPRSRQFGEPLDG